MASFLHIIQIQIDHKTATLGGQAEMFKLKTKLLPKLSNYSNLINIDEILKKKFLKKPKCNLL